MVRKSVIIGVPQSGKTTHANANYPEDMIVHTDDLLSTVTDWSKRSEKIVEVMLEKEEFCIEGCDAVRGLRKFMKQNPEKKPADLVVWWGTPRTELSNRQAGFGKGCKKIFDEILPELLELGVGVTIES